MKIAVLGTGMVGRTLAARLAELGHSVQIGTRDPGDTLARTGVDPMSGEPFGIWQQNHRDISLAAYADAVAFGELVINATNGQGTLAALEAAGEANLAGKVLIDVSNPLDFSGGTPTLFVSNSDSLAEQIQRAHPRAQVVKTLNTVNAGVMVHPEMVAGGEHSVFLSGNDPAAKNAARDLLVSFGWRDIIDLGDITTARGPEMYLPLWLRLWGALGTGLINIHVAR